MKKILAEIEALKKEHIPEKNGIVKEASILFLGSVIGAITGISLQYVFAANTFLGFFLFALLLLL